MSSPTSGSILDLAAANWTTALGALCFLVGALLLPAREPKTPLTHLKGGIT